MNMSRLERLWLLSAQILAMSLIASAGAAGGDDDDDDDADDGQGIAPHQVVVTLENGFTIEEVVADYDDYGAITVLATIEPVATYLLLIPDAWEEEFFEEQIEDDPRVEDAESNFEFGTVGGQTQSFYLNVFPSAYDTQYTPDLINLNAAHTVATGDGVVVALLDTGVDAAHELLAGRMHPASVDLVDGLPEIQDVGNGVDDDGDGVVDELVGHGTFMAGLLAMVAPDAQIMSVRVLDSEGNGDSFTVVQGVFHAIEAGADVINLSLTTSEDEGMLGEALAAARAAGITIVAAAGNLDSDDEMVLVEHPATIGVAATDAFDIKTAFSNYGGVISVSAPGAEIVSAVPDNGYGKWDGTSMSAALVSGAAALVISADPDVTPESVETAILGSAIGIDVANPEYAGLLGSGRLDTGAALSADPGSGPSPMDLDSDGVVGPGDLAILLAAWGDCPGQPPCFADLDGNGDVGPGDLALLLSNWG